ncbi:glycosyltransferase family 4 protein [Candidatus Sumerlaeota bacterium]|nr:glycosyltransferase family 4 protein [Candidatus Sumerlaeota bacterium]
MRILLLLDDYEITAFSQAVVQHCERWHAMRQITMSSVAFGPAGPLEDLLRKSGIGTQPVPAVTCRDVMNLNAEGKKHLYTKDRPDLVLAFCRWPAMPARLFHGGNPYVPLLLSLNDDMAGAPSPIAVRVAGLFRERSTRGHLLRIIAPTRREKKALLAAGIPEDKIARIPPGVNAVEAYPLPDHKRARYRMLMGLPHDTPLIVSMCSHDDLGIDELLEIIRKVLAQVPTARLFIFSDEAAMEETRRKIEGSGAASSISLVGAMTSIQSKIFSSADVMLHVCAGGGAYTRVAEAQACATAVVAYRSTSLDELLIDGETGVLVDRGNHSEAAAQIVALLNDGERRARLGASARNFILEHHEATGSAEKYVKLWRDAAPDADWKTTTGSISLEELDAIREDMHSSTRTPLPTKRSLKGKLP